MALDPLDEASTAADVLQDQRPFPRVQTRSAHRAAIERAVSAMQRDIGGTLPLHVLAREARMSLFHFVRVFRDVTGLPPRRFLSALRLARARELLLATSDSVSDVCFDVGYSSLGTFTRQFTALIGFSPRRLRELALPKPALPVQRSAFGLPSSSAAAACCPPPHSMSVELLGAPETSTVFVGFFATPLPSGRPLSCAVCSPASDANRSVRIELPTRPAFLLAAAIPLGTAGMGECWVGAYEGNPLAVAAPGLAPPRVQIRLRPPTSIDPPLLSFLPLLLRERSATASPERRAR